MNISNKVRSIIVGCITLIFTTSLFAQENSIAFDFQKYSSETETQTTSSNGKENDGEKHYFIAFAGGLLVSGILSGWNRYVSGGAWAQVGWDDVKEFWTKDVKFDKDWYWTNFVLHPYQGGLYYMMARGSNLNKIESFAYSVLGSTIWEYFCETNSPSINDMVYTPIGGFVTGEMLFRLSQEADNINSMLGKVISPSRLFTDPIIGQPLPYKNSHIEDFSCWIGIGTQKHYTKFLEDNAPDSQSELFPVFAQLGFDVVYNDPYGWDTNDPYSQFELNMHGGFGIGSGEVNGGGEDIMYDIALFSTGILLSRQIDRGDNKDTSVALIFDYDFNWQSSIEFSSIAPGFGYFQRINLANKNKIEWQFHQDIVIMGTSDYYYFMHETIPNPDKSCDYTYSTGLKTAFIWNYETARGSLFHTDFSLFSFWNYPYEKATNHFDGFDLIGILNINYELTVSDFVNIGIANNLYGKLGIYENINDFIQNAYTGTVFAKIKTGAIRR